MGDARELYGREVRRLIDGNLRSVELVYRRQRLIGALSKGAPHAAIVEHGATCLEYCQQDQVHFKWIEICYSEVFAAVPTVCRLALTTIATITPRQTGIIPLQRTYEPPCRCLHLQAFTDGNQFNIGKALIP